jgi:7,8-dihydroneopterin aldolase/epimerase/oxygenase
MTRGLTIVVEGIKLRGRCGVTSEERAVGQTLIVDVALGPIDFPAARSDDLHDTIDYADVVDLVRSIVEQREFRVLERLATVIADAIWDRFRLQALEVAVAKPSPPVAIPVALARVTVTRAS